MTHDDDDALKGAATTPDDATFVSPPPMTIPEAAQTGGADAPVPTSSTAVQESAPPPGLTDQTNFLPTRQVVTVFLGMTVAVMCSFLDQTMCVISSPHRILFDQTLVASRQRCRVSPLNCTRAKRVHG
jgi:hypothetical protein